MKSKKYILILLVIILAIIAFICLLTHQNEKKKDIRTYTSQISLKRFNNLRYENNKKGMLIYIGNSSCSDCSLFDPELIRLIQNKEISKKIYYLDINELHMQSKKWKKFKNRNNIYGTPSFVYYGNEVKTLSHSDTSAPKVSELKEWIQDCKISD